jgi:hypothetical protein
MENCKAARTHAYLPGERWALAATHTRTCVRAHTQALKHAPTDPSTHTQACTHVHTHKHAHTQAAHGVSLAMHAQHAHGNINAWRHATLCLGTWIAAFRSHALLGMGEAWPGWAQEGA